MDAGLNAVEDGIEAECQGVRGVLCGVERRADTALLVIALRQPDADGQEVTASGQVHAEAVDLSGRRQAVALRPVATSGYIDHVGTVNTAARDSLRVEVAVVWCYPKKPGPPWP